MTGNGVTFSATTANANEAYWYQRCMVAEAELKRLQYRYGTCPRCGGPMELPGLPGACAKCEFPEANK